MDIRREIKRNISSLSAEIRAKKNKEVLEKIISLDCIKGNVLSYVSLMSEVGTEELNKYIIKQTNLLLPRIKGENLEIVEIKEGTTFSLGTWGISEPDGDNFDGDIDVSIVPLSCFDLSLNRMGKGKGYYDRFFAKHSCFKIGVAYDLQQREFIVNEWDIPMDIIITETRILKRK